MKKGPQLPLTLNIEPSSERVMWSLGHSNKSLAEFIERLQDYRIDRVVDVRTKPYSRWCPHFNRASLEHELAQADMNYDWRGLHLGGLQDNVDYEQNIRELARLAGAERIVLVCSEASPTKCHRKIMLQPEFEKLGFEIVHILYPPK
jgi:uncharacterized protein (DUF488 family)